MAVPLNKVPQGLLDFFGIKSGEWGPRELGQQLVPVIELGRWYLDGYALEVAATPTASPWLANTGAGGVNLTDTTPTDLVLGGTSILVPQNQVWLILEATTGWSYSSTAGISGELYWTSRGCSLPTLLTGATASDGAVSKAGLRSLVRPFWARPGDTIALNTTGFTIPGGSVTAFQTRLRLARFQI